MSPNTTSVDASPSLPDVCHTLDFWFPHEGFQSPLSKDTLWNLLPYKAFSWMPSPRIHIQNFNLSFLYSTILGQHLISASTQTLRHLVTPTELLTTEHRLYKMSPTWGLFQLSGFSLANFSMSAPFSSIFNGEPLSDPFFNFSEEYLVQIPTHCPFDFTLPGIPLFIPRFLELSIC